MKIFEAMLISFLLVLPSTAQQSAWQTSAGRKDPHVERALTAPGQILSKGNNDRPVGKLKVKTYRLERVKLDAPYVRGDGRSTEYAHKLIITGGPFPGGYTLWLNDLALSVVSSADERELIFLFQYTGGDSGLEDGATLTVTEGANLCRTVEGSASELPDRLSLPPELRAVPRDSSAIKLRSIRAERMFGGKPAVNITVTTKELLEIKNIDLSIQTGKQGFEAGGFGYKPEALIPYDVFAQIPDNSQVILKWGRCTPGGTVVGQLNKSALDR